MKKGFTLLEILLVIAAIGILAAIVIVAINPNRQLAQVRNSERQSEVNNISKAFDQYLIDQGSYPSGLTAAGQELCAQDASDCTGFLDVRSALVPTYLAAIPSDPQATGNGTGYRVAISTVNDKVSISVISPELDNEIAINEFELLLEDTTATAAYSLRQLEPTATQAVRVRRASDNAEVDIGFTDNGLLDSSSLANFMSGSNGYVVTWYDQSGSGLDATQPSQSNQPKIYDAVSGIVTNANGSYGIEFISANSNAFAIPSVPNIPTTQDWLVSFVAHPTVNKNWNGLITFVNGGTGAFYLEHNTRAFYYDSSSSVLHLSSQVIPEDSLSLYVHTRVAGSHSWFINGVDGGVDADTPASNFTSSQWTIGFNSSDRIDGIVSEINIYLSDQSSNRDSIEENINRHYSIF